MTLGTGTERVTEPKLKAVIYSRVSTQDQSTDNQVPILEAWAKQRDYELVGSYIESETAWRDGHQKELARLLGDARHYKFDFVLVWALDRLSREGPTAILNLISKLGQCQVKVLSYEEPWTEAPGQLGELLFAIAGWVAKMESDRRSERTKAGLLKAQRDGKTLGRPKGSKDKVKRGRRGYLLRYASPALREKYTK